jgi:hypothetical protein
MGEGLQDDPSPIIIRDKVEWPSPARGEGAITSTVPDANFRHRLFRGSNTLPPHGCFGPLTGGSDLM